MSGLIIVSLLWDRHRLLGGTHLWRYDGICKKHRMSSVVLEAILWVCRRGFMHLFAQVEKSGTIAAHYPETTYGGIWLVEARIEAVPTDRTCLILWGPTAWRVALKCNYKYLTHPIRISLLGLELDCFGNGINATWHGNVTYLNRTSKEDPFLICFYLYIS